MAKQLPKLPTQPSLVAPSEQLVTSMLKRLRGESQSENFIAQQWKRLQKQQPNVAHFITATSYQTAPNDPEARALIASSMLGLYILLGEARLHQEVRTLFGDALSEYFIQPNEDK